jgi:PAS domain S-box-containing protein
MKTMLAPDFKSLFETAPGPYLVLLPNFTIAAVNDAYLKATMTERESIVGHGLFEIFPDNPDDNEADGVLNLRASLNYVLQHKKPHTMAVQKYDIRRPNGVFEERYWSPLNTPVLNSKNEVDYIIHNVTDVTSSQRVREQLESLSLQINQSNEAIYTTDVNRTIKSWNHGAEVLYGFSAAEAIGMNSVELLKTTITANEITIIENQLLKYNYWTGELKRSAKNGKQIYVRSSLTASKDNNGKIIGYISVNFDITQQKSLQEQVNHLVNIVEQSSEAIFSRGLNQRIISWNNGAEKLFGYSKEEAIGKIAAEIKFIKLTSEEIANTESQIASTGTWKSERNFYHKNGLVFFGSVTGNCIKNEKGEITSFYFIVKDISHRKQLEEQLKKHNEELEEKVKERTKKIYENEKRFRALVENNHDIISLIDESLHVIYRSPSASRIMGWTKEEMKVLEGLENVHPDDKEKAQQIIQQVKANPGKPVNALFRRQHKAGHYIWLEGVITNLLDDEQVKAIVTNFRDVTERLETEKKLITSEKRFRALIENNFDIISLMDETFKIIYRSPSAFRFNGWTDEEMNSKDGTSNVHPDDREFAINIVKELMANPGKQIPCLFRNQHKNGHYLWVEGVVTNLLHDEYVKAIVFNFRDVTERIEAEKKIISSEKRFRSLIENISDAIVLNDADSNIVYQSSSVTKILGYAPQERTGGKVLDYIHPENHSDFLNLYEKLKQTPGIPLPFQYRSLHKNGKYIWLEGVVTNLINDPAVNAYVANYRDITQRKEAEEVLNQNKIFIESIINASPDIIYIYDIEEQKNIYVNDGIQIILGYNDSEIKQMGNQILSVLMQPDDFDFYIKNTLPRYTTAKDKEIIMHEYRMQNKDGSWHWLYCKESVFLRSPDGSPKQIFGITTDITERKKAELEIARVYKEMDTAFSRITDSVVSVDNEWRYTFINDAALTTHQMGREGAMGKMIWDVHPGLSETIFGKRFKEAMETQIAMEFENYYPPYDIWVNMKIYPSKNGLTLYYEDITKRKVAEENLIKSEKIYKTIASSIPGSMICLLDRDYKYLLIEGDIIEKLGYSKEKMLGNKAEDILLPEIFEMIKDEFKRTFNGEIITRENSRLGYDTISKFIPLKDEDGSVYAMMTVTLDVTTLKNAQRDVTELNRGLEEKIVRRTRQLKKSNEELEAFSYSVSHDLRAPLRAIIGFTSILEEDYSSKLDDEAKRITGVIKSNTLKMGHLVDDLLAFSRMSRHDIIKDSIDTNKIVQEIIENTDINKSSKIEWTVPQLPFSRADLNTIRQVWVNLISNAVKYSGNAVAPQIEIGSYKQDGQLVFFVKDNGVGFDEKYKDKLFKVFQRLHGAEEFEGTGIGLAIVQKIISKHGGNVWASSAVNKGATFFFSIPDDDTKRLKN